MVWDLEELSYFWWNPHDCGLNYTDLFKEQQKVFFFYYYSDSCWVLDIN